MQDIKAYSLSDLKTLAAEKKIPGRSAMNKADLYAALSALETPTVVVTEQAGTIDTETFIEPIGSWSPDVYQDEVTEFLAEYKIPTYREALNIQGWKRAPRKLKKIWRNYGIIAAA